jgi:hypothetical protein
MRSLETEVFYEVGYTPFLISFISRTNANEDGQTHRACLGHVLDNNAKAGGQNSFSKHLKDFINEGMEKVNLKALK